MLTELDQITEEFVQLCGSPCAVMTLHEFRHVARKLGMADSYCEGYFRFVACSRETLLTRHSVLMHTYSVCMCVRVHGMDDEMACAHLFVSGFLKADDINIVDFIVSLIFLLTD